MSAAHESFRKYLTYARHQNKKKNFSDSVKYTLIVKYGKQYLSCECMLHCKSSCFGNMTVGGVGKISACVISIMILLEWNSVHFLQNSND